MVRDELTPQTLLGLLPNVAHSVGYMATWGSGALSVSLAHGIDAALGGPGRH
ncbi:hypothetical protein [Dietzia sp. UBA5065]|uniref:hypothetical protein n=1 Tax=Dietzia sp. UBA5065 TaxID=1946422 RepID=UPI0025BE4579|nr:hypothetical protein [Dietzia sp. UBA5065]HMT48941.1 hypothetical protein [Dietzia sp.]